MDEHSIRTPWAASSDEVVARYEVAVDEGLSEDEAERRRERVGPNVLREAEQRGWWGILADQFESFIVLLLAVAGVAAFALNENVEGVAIFVVLLLNGLIGFVTEMRALKSMEGLQEMVEIEARVRREGEVETVSAADLVPGDVVILTAGNVVPADLRVIDPSRLQADESALTGESVPVGKTSDALAEDAPLAERENMLYKGTSVTRGTAEAVVVSTGMDTELGKISASLQGAVEEKTPLQQKLDELAQKLVPFLLVVAAIVLVSGWLRGQDL